MRPFPRLMLLLAALLLAQAVAACGSGGSKKVAVGPRPDGVPESAKPVDSDRSFGQVRHLVGGTIEAPDAPRVDSISCDSDVLAIVTSSSRIYAAIPCDRVPAQATSLAGQRAALRLQVEPRKLFIETEQGYQAEFSPRDMWVE